MITDEMVEKARMAYVEAEPFMSGSWKSGCLRAALEAVAPMLIAQGMRKMANALHHIDDSPALMKAIDAAIAQELDPK